MEQKKRKRFDEENSKEVDIFVDKIIQMLKEGTKASENRVKKEVVKFAEGVQ